MTDIDPHDHDWHLWTESTDEPYFYCRAGAPGVECDERMSWRVMVAEYTALKTKEKWHNQTVEWLRQFHPEVALDYSSHIAGIHKNIEGKDLVLVPKSELAWASGRLDLTERIAIEELCTCDESSDVEEEHDWHCMYRQRIRDG